MAIEVLAPAKINLALHVIGRTDTGYHRLESLVAFTDFGDMIRVQPADSLSLAITGPQSAFLPVADDNLVLRAARSFGIGHGARIGLDKHLPVASGIGGGSADAAATLRALARLWTCDLPPAQAILALGADVPVCVYGQAALMQGIGERITPWPLPKAWIVLANCGQPLSSSSVFAALQVRVNQALPSVCAFADLAGLAAFLRQQRNDLQPAAITLVPAIADTVDAIAAQDGCLVARMSGSGATCFGLFANPALATNAAAALRRARPAWWVASGALAGP